MQGLQVQMYNFYNCTRRQPMMAFPFVEQHASNKVVAPVYGCSCDEHYKDDMIGVDRWEVRAMML